ncbi:MAG: histidine kinase [Lachnospiraceae bacterium]|nr:histidine kinase [Lachnospiraceae bacterium]
MLLNLLCLYHQRKELSKRQFAAFLTYLILPLVCMAIQMAWYGLLMVVIGTSDASAFMLGLLIREQIEMYIKQQEEIAGQKLSILMLEMRPHFIYNTLTSIYYLCEQDIKKAQQVTLDFSVYLRKNFNAIGKKDTIPFAEELEHTKAYLAVEMTRFEGHLFVKYDFAGIPVFRIPPLTLQPLVENCIKHGLDPELDPLHITISVLESAKGNTVIVEDDGRGFTMTEDDEPHIALKNIRERLKYMCDGTLTIEPRKGGGTKVSIFIPQPSLL